MIEMPIYRLSRHVVCGREVWGIDRPVPRLQTICAPRDTDECDPLRRDCGTLLLKMDGDFVTWHRIFEWISVAEEAGYQVISGFENITPFSVIVLRGP